MVNFPIFTCNCDDHEDCDFKSSFLNQFNVDYCSNSSLIDGVDFFQNDKVFGCLLNLQSGSVKDVQHFFFLTKKLVNSFRSSVINKNREKCLDEWIEVRKEVSKFLSLIKYQARFKIGCEKVTIIVNELKNLLLFLGRLSSFENNIINELIFNIRKQSAVNQYYHLCLDIWWVSSQILLILNSKLCYEINLTRNSIDLIDFRSQLIEILFTDLIYLSSQKFYHSPENKNICNLSPFICKCMKEFFILIRWLIDQNNLLTNLHPFWLHFNNIFDKISTQFNQESQGLKYLTIIPSNFTLENNVEVFKVWLTSNLIPLFGYDKNGDFDEKKLNSVQDCNINASVKSITLLLKSEESLGNYQFSKTLPSLLRLCLRLSQFCYPSVDILLPFLDFFMKNIFKTSNEVFSNEIVPKSAQQWSRTLIQLFKNGSVSDCENLNLNLFLILIYRILSKLKISQDRLTFTYWQKLKGRLYSKINLKRTEDLNLSNLFNLVSILITLCYASGDYWFEIGNKLCDICKILMKKGLISDRIKLMIRALFCLLHLLNSQNNLLLLIEMNSFIFEKLCEMVSLSEFNEKSLNLNQTLLSDLTFLYLDEVECLIQTQVKLTHIEKLINPSILILFNKLIDRELLTLLNLIDSFLDSLKDHVYFCENDSIEHIKPMISFCIKYFLPYFKSQFLNKHCQFNLSKIAANLVKITLFKDFPKVASIEFRNNFFYFGVNPKVENENSLKMCELIFKDDHSLIRSQTILLFPEIIARLIRCDEGGQVKVKQVLKCFLNCIETNWKQDGLNDYLFPAIQSFIHQYLGSEPISKMFRALDVCISVDLSIKNKLVPVLLQTLNEIELKKHGTDDSLRDAISKFLRQK